MHSFTPLFTNQDSEGATQDMSLLMWRQLKSHDWTSKSNSPFSSHVCQSSFILPPSPATLLLCFHHPLFSSSFPTHLSFSVHLSLSCSIPRSILLCPYPPPLSLLSLLFSSPHLFPALALYLHSSGAASCRRKSRITASGTWPGPPAQHQPFGNR